MILPCLLVLQATKFVDRSTDLGLSFGTDQACWVDVDNDGWVHLAVSGAFWKSEAGKRFSKIADVGLVVAADFDNDGFNDPFSLSQMKLWHNDGGKTITD